MTTDEILEGVDLSGLDGDGIRFLRGDVEGYLNGNTKKNHFTQQARRFDKGVDQYEKISKSIGIPGSGVFADKDRIKRKEFAENQIRQYKRLSYIYYTVYKKLPRVKK